MSCRWIQALQAAVGTRKGISGRKNSMSKDSEAYLSNDRRRVMWQAEEEWGLPVWLEM